MNERIKQLIEQATTIEHGVDNGFDRVTFDKEKFAELIVQDIILKIDQEIDLAYEQEEAWTASTLQALSLEILEHFDMELPDDA